MSKTQREIIKKEKEKEKILIIRCSRSLRDEISIKAAEDFIKGGYENLGPGSFSSNEVISKIFAHELGLTYEKKQQFSKESAGKIGISIRVPDHIYVGLEARSKSSGISVNQLMNQILESNLPDYPFNGDESR